MKKIGVILAILGVVVIIGYSNRATQPTVNETQDVLGKPLETERTVLSNITHEGISYEVVSIKTDNTHSLSLHSNLDNSEKSTDLFETNDCTTLVNAGFYTPENTPVGYLKTSDGEVQMAKDNALFNGFLTINSVGTPKITRDLPLDTVIGVQSGPTLFINSFIRNMNIARDKEARRTVAITTGDNELIFLSIYKPNSMFSGPLLENLPGVINTWQQESDIDVADAINLDGGTHSALITEDVKITEASPIGSYFCIRED